jgi:hypothetical protein
MHVVTESAPLFLFADLPGLLFMLAMVRAEPLAQPASHCNASE